MSALYPMHTALPSLLLASLLCAGCGRNDQSTGSAVPDEPWPNEHEELFQQAEALKYSLQQQQLEEQRLRDAQLPVEAPAPR